MWCYRQKAFQSESKKKFNENSISRRFPFDFGFVFYSVRWNKIPSAENLGNFELLIDEELAAQTQDDNLLNNLTGKQRVNNRWK